MFFKKVVALLAIRVHNFIKLLKRGFKTDLNLRLRCKSTKKPPISTSTWHLIHTTLHNIRDLSSARANTIPSSEALRTEETSHGQPTGQWISRQIH